MAEPRSHESRCSSVSLVDLRKDRFTYLLEGAGLYAVNCAVCPDDGPNVDYATLFTATGQRPRWLGLIETRRSALATREAVLAELPVWDYRQVLAFRGGHYCAVRCSRRKRLSSA